MSTAVDWKVMLTAIIGVFMAVGAVLLFAWIFITGAEISRPSRIRRVFFAGLAALYAIYMSIGIVRVILGKESPHVLLGIPGGMLLFGLFLRSAKNTGSSARLWITRSK